MIRSTVSLLFSASALFCLCVVAGCSQSSSGVDPALLAQHRTRLTLNEEPEGILTVVDVRETLLGEEHIHEEHGDHDHADHAGEDHDAHDHEDHAEHDHAADVSDDEETLAADDHDHDAHDHDAHDHDDSEHDTAASHDHADHEGHDHSDEHVHASGPIEVAMVGQVGGLTNPWAATQPDFPFVMNQAALFLADPQAVVENEESGHVHAPGEECAFCAEHAGDNTALLAMVRMVDENGEVLRMDVRDLFDLKEKDTVVVRGTARVVEGGMLMVDATGLYVRR